MKILVKKLLKDKIERLAQLLDAAKQENMFVIVTLLTSMEIMLSQTGLIRNNIYKQLPIDLKTIQQPSLGLKKNLISTLKVEVKKKC